MQLGHQLCVVVIFFTSRKKKLRTFFAVRTFLSRLARDNRPFDSAVDAAW